MNTVIYRYMWLLIALSLTGAASAQTSSTDQPPPPSGPHFTFVVPYLLKDLPPEVRSGNITCYVYAEPEGSQTTPLGTATSAFFVTPNSLGGSRTVSITLANADTPTLKSIKSYSCELGLTGVVAGVPVTFIGPGATFGLPSSRKFLRVQGPIPL